MKLPAPIVVFAALLTCVSASAQSHWLDMRVAVVDDTGTVNVEQIFVAPLIEEALYLSAVRTLPPPGGSVLIEAESHASLSTGLIYVRADCLLVAQNCSSKASWKDVLTFDLTGIPGDVTLDVNAQTIGEYGPAVGTGYTIFVQSSTNVVVDTMRVQAGYVSSTLTSVSNPTTFQLYDQAGSWSVVGPDVFVGQLTLQGGAINNVHVETILNTDTQTDILSAFTISGSPVPFTSSSGVFLGSDPDSDGDGVVDVQDNCTVQANPGQDDADGDGFGNLCDADFNNDCVVNVVDLGFFKSVFFSSNAVADLNSDGTVNSADLGLLRLLFNLAPGPSGRPNVCD